MLGNNLPCDVVGIGYVELKLHDGSLKILTKVRHVLGLKRNLVSIGMLDESSLSCKTNSGAIKIAKGSLVIMRGIKQNCFVCNAEFD